MQTMKSSVHFITFMFLSLISCTTAKKSKPDRDHVKKQVKADISFKSEDELLTKPCYENNLCFFMGYNVDINNNDNNRPDKSQNHLKLTAKDTKNCDEEYCMRVNFRPYDANCSKYLVFMGIINKKKEVQGKVNHGRSVHQWIGIGFKRSSNSMFTAYGMYCREKYHGLYYGEIVDKSKVEFDQDGVKFFDKNRDHIHPELVDESTTAEDGMFYCSFTVPRYLEAFAAEDEHIDIATGDFYILLASGMKWATEDETLVNCNTHKPEAECSIVEHRDWSDKHYVRGNTKDQVSKGGEGWGICCPDPHGSGAASILLNCFVFWSLALTFISMIQFLR